ncbi:MAG: peptidylprolyl isomerase [Candidatus Omnitrophica bacterium]|nr:peptidylprolyl isomerase [Candidatus Omnitrophota bacterium]MCB9721627.1 peptidylprolyl isomerase [Candidatus Omnitrophota bacterium]
MKIENGKVAMIHYSLKNDAGDTIDSTVNDAPMGYLHGHSNLMPGLEKALDGRAQGEKFSMSLAPEEAFGPHDELKIKKVPKEHFDGLDDLKEGMHLQVNSPQGAQIATVQAVGEAEVTVDFNHPLAGQTLHFEIEVLEIREATAEELEHGHIHGAGGCGH